jgi:type IX secretion system PorP/SprF family membrane protein
MVFFHLHRFLQQRLLVLLGFLALGTSLRAQQDPQFTQFRFQPFLFNPAAAGSEAGLDLTALVRAQWVGLEGAPQSQSLAGHLPLYGLSSGLGFSVWNDLSGVQRVTGFYAAYAYRLELGPQSSLSVGLSAGGLQQAIEGDRLRAPQGSYEDGQIEHNDNFLPNTNVQAMALDFGAGLWFQSRRLRAGLSTTHLTEPDVTFDLNGASSSIAMKRHYYVTTSYKISLNSNLELEPGVQVKTDLASSMADLNALLLIRGNIWAGASFRTYFDGQADAVGGLVGANISNRLGLGYAYDYPLSALNQVSSGSHELMVRYRVAVEKPRQGKRINNLRYLHY